MLTLIRIPAGHMRFVPYHKQSDEAAPTLSPAKWPVESVLIADFRGREAFLSHDRINQIVRLAIRATCALSQEQTRFFPNPPLSRSNFRGCLTPTPRRSLPAQPATPPRTIPGAYDRHDWDQHLGTHLHPGDHTNMEESPNDPKGSGPAYPGTASRRGGGGYIS